MRRKRQSVLTLVLFLCLGGCTHKYYETGWSQGFWIDSVTIGAIKWEDTQLAKSNVITPGNNYSYSNMNAYLYVHSLRTNRDSLVATLDRDLPSPQYSGSLCYAKPWVVYGTTRSINAYNLDTHEYFVVDSNGAASALALSSSAKYLIYAHYPSYPSKTYDMTTRQVVAVFEGYNTIFTPFYVDENAKYVLLWQRLGEDWDSTFIFKYDLALALVTDTLRWPVRPLHVTDYGKALLVSSSKEPYCSYCSTTNLLDTSISFQQTGISNFGPLIMTDMDLSTGRYLNPLPSCQVALGSIFDTTGTLKSIFCNERVQQ